MNTQVRSKAGRFWYDTRSPEEREFPFPFQLGDIQCNLEKQYTEIIRESGPTISTVSYYELWNEAHAVVVTELKTDVVEIGSYYEFRRKYIHLIIENMRLYGEIEELRNQLDPRQQDDFGTRTAGPRPVFSSEYSAAVRKAIKKFFPKVKRIKGKTQVDEWSYEEYMVFQIISDEKDHEIVYRAMSDIIKELSPEFHNLVIRTKLVYNDEWY